MGIPFAAYVATNAPRAVASALDQMPDGALLSADPEQLVEQLFDQFTVREFPGDLDALRESHDAVITDHLSNEVRVTLSQQGLSEYGPLLALSPSSGANIELHVNSDDSMWFTSTVARLTSGDLDLVIGNIKQLNRDVQKESPLLRQHIANIVQDRVRKARAEQERRDRTIAEAAAAGIRIRRPEDPAPLPAEGAQPLLGDSPNTRGGASISLTFRAIPDPVRHETALTLLGQLERDLNTLHDLGELGEEGLSILEQDAIPLVKALRAILQHEATTESERRGVAKEALVKSGRALQAIVSMGRTVGSVAGLTKLPEIIDSGQTVIEGVVDAISGAL
ncbi:MAG: hypothetical protein HY875_10810 [Chloroflexi bacterium]|nr:hypothetical protein [Chloroflexota bacterium]